MKWLAAAALLAAIGVGGFFTLLSGPAQLDAADRLFGSRGSSRVATAQRFGTHGQMLDVWSPDNTGPNGKRPVLIFLYGGSWNSGARQDYGFAGRAFASKGLVTVIPDYRKAPANRFPDFVEDAAQAVKWTVDNIARYGGDPGRIAIAGHSAGAHIAALLTLNAGYLKDVAVDPHTIRAFVGISGPYDFLPFTNPAAKDALGHWPRPEETQPIHYVHSGAAPALLMTGDKDTTVKPRNSIVLAAALQKAGVRAEVRHYPAMDHTDPVMALSQPFARKGPVLDDAAAFLDSVLENAAAQR